jgi:hypothetical protein
MNFGTAFAIPLRTDQCNEFVFGKVTKETPMKLAILAAVMMTASMASADILRPGNIKTTNIVGKRAAHLYETMAGPSMPGDQLRTQVSSYKVERSENGLRQVVCEKTLYWRGVSKPPSYRCTTQQSLDGRQVPRFRPIRRLG